MDDHDETIIEKGSESKELSSKFSGTVSVTEDEMVGVIRRIITTHLGVYDPEDRSELLSRDLLNYVTKFIGINMNSDSVDTFEQRVREFTYTIPDGVSFEEFLSDVERYFVLSVRGFKRNLTEIAIGLNQDLESIREICQRYAKGMVEPDYQIRVHKKSALYPSQLLRTD